MMKMKKILCIALSMLILVFPFSNMIIAENMYLRGDIDNNGSFNVIDLVLFRKYLLNVVNIELYPADMNVDGLVDIRDFIRMKKYFLGDVLHNNSMNVGMSWTILDDAEGMPIVSFVGFRIYTNCYVRTACLPGRYTTEISAYISTDINPNPELDSPELNIASTTINDRAIEMSDNEFNIVPVDKIFASNIAYSQIHIPELSKYECLFIVMLNDKAINPYRETENIFYF